MVMWFKFDRVEKAIEIVNVKIRISVSVPGSVFTKYEIKNSIFAALENCKFESLLCTSAKWGASNFNG